MKDMYHSALVYMVRIPDSHSGGPGSIPGCGTFLFLIITIDIKYPCKRYQYRKASIIYIFMNVKI